jgi:integrase
MQGARALSHDELNEILAIASPRDRVLVLTGISFGTRISEALKLTFADVEGEVLHLKSSKNSQNQGFPIPAGYKAAIKALKAYYRDKGIEPKRHTRIFLETHVLPFHVMSRQAASDAVRRLAKKIGAEGKVSSHSFRKSFVTRIYEKTGFNIAETQKYSRHKSLSNLEYYISTCDEMTLINDQLWA